jgi:hypothetical protein
MNNIDRSLANLTKMRREKTQINKIRNAKGEITANTVETQGIIRDYFENLYSNTFDNVKEIDKFLDTYDHPRLNEEYINLLNGSITQNKIEATIKGLPRKEKSDGLSVEFYCTLKEELIPTVHKLFQDIERERTLPNSFYDARITPILKPDKDTSKKEIYRPISSLTLMQ